MCFPDGSVDTQKWGVVRFADPVGVVTFHSTGPEVNTSLYGMGSKRGRIERCFAIETNSGQIADING